MSAERWADQDTPALAIVARGDQVIEHDQAHFTIKSQSRPGNIYAVKLDGPAPSCECDHHRTAGRECIHILAARYYLEIQRRGPDGAVKTERVRLTYKQAWSAYNAAQTAEVRLFDALLADLVQAVPEPAYKGTGRPPLPLREQAFCAIQKTYSQLSSRRAASLFGNAKERGQIEHAPHFNVSTKFLNRADATPILHELVRLTAAPLASVEREFAVDSTGFRTTTFGDYCAEKHGPQRRNIWLKAHLCVGVRTNIIAQVRVTDGNGADGPQFIPLVAGIRDAGFTVGEVSADKAYSSRANHEALAAMGGQAYIPFKVNATHHFRGSAAWAKAFRFFTLNRDEFEERYHKRSNVESTIGAMKKKLGETLKSKNRVAQENELLCKVIAYNVTVLIHEMHENGLQAEWLNLKLAACTGTPVSQGV